MFRQQVRRQASEEPILTGQGQRQGKSASQPQPGHPLLHLQQMVGNRAVGRLLQAKLTINQPGDEYEREADYVAEQVMRMPEQGLRRQVYEEEEDRLRTKLPVQQPVSREAGGSEAPPVVHEVLRSPGQPLDHITRAFMEPRFGYDLSQVRVHVGAEPAMSASVVNARAYTVGHNVVFGAGEYEPHSYSGRQLLAHELSHVVQQSTSLGRKISESNSRILLRSGPRLARAPVTAANMRIREDILKEITRNSRQKDDPEWVKLGELFERVPESLAADFHAMLVNTINARGEKGDALAKYFYANVPEPIQAGMLSILRRKYLPPSEADPLRKEEVAPQKLELAVPKTLAPQKPKRTRVEAAILQMERLRKMASQDPPDYESIMKYLEHIDKFLRDNATDYKMDRMFTQLGWDRTDATQKVIEARGGPKYVMGLIRSRAPRSMIERGLNEATGRLRRAKSYLEALMGEGKLPESSTFPSWSEIKETLYEALIDSLRSLQKSSFDAIRKRSSSLPTAVQPMFQAAVDSAEIFIDILITVLLTVVGIAVGFGEGVVSAVWGLIQLVYGIVKWVVFLLGGFIDNGKAFEKYNRDIIRGLNNLGPALKKLVDDWLEKFKTAPIDRVTIMIGELTGQIIALIATFGVTASKVGQIPKLTIKIAVPVEGKAMAMATTTMAVDVSKPIAATAFTGSQAMAMEGKGTGEGGKKEPKPEPTAAASREVFKQPYKQYKDAGWKPQGPHKAIKPDPAKYPTVEIRPNGDIFGSYKDLDKYVKEAELTAKRRAGESSIESHHLLEDNVMKDFGISKNEGWSVGLEWSEHAVFTKELPNYLRRRSQKLFYDIDDVFKAHSEMYQAHELSEWIPEMKNFLRQNRDRIKGVYNTGKVPSAKAPDFAAIKDRVFKFLDRL